MSFSYSLVEYFQETHPSIRSWTTFMVSKFVDHLMINGVPFPDDTFLSDDGGMILSWQKDSVFYEYKVEGDKNWNQFQPALNSLILTLSMRE